MTVGSNTDEPDLPTGQVAQPPSESLASDLNTIALRCANRPVTSPLSADDILGYDDLEAPTR